MTAMFLVSGTGIYQAEAIRSVFLNSVVVRDF